jgi:hypothetical protein
MIFLQDDNIFIHSKHSYMQIYYYDIISLLKNVENLSVKNGKLDSLIVQNININLPRSIRRGRKRSFLIVFDSFSSDRITAVFHRIVNERKRSYSPFSGRLWQLLAVHDTTKNGRNTITTKWSIYTP